jgi:hypothetical protein
MTVSFYSTFSSRRQLERLTQSLHHRVMLTPRMRLCVGSTAICKPGLGCTTCQKQRCFYQQVYWGYLNNMAPYRTLLELLVRRQSPPPILTHNVLALRRGECRAQTGLHVLAQCVYSD